MSDHLQSISRRLAAIRQSGRLPLLVSVSESVWREIEAEVGTLNPYIVAHSGAEIGRTIEGVPVEVFEGDTESTGIMYEVARQDA